MPGPTECFFGSTFRSRGFDFTFSPGVQPSVCNLYTVPHVLSLPQVADLVFHTEGEGNFLFPNCLLEEPALDASKAGKFWRLPIKDRRWKWELATTYGSYNLPRPDTNFTREKTPQQLAALLFNDISEGDADVSRLPNDARPLAAWQDGVNTASALDQLCASLGCIVTLNPFTNRAEIWPTGQGRALPPLTPTDGSTFVPVLHPKPTTIRVDAGPTLFQGRFDTEAVGLDVDDHWKPIDDLSYKPAVGWGRAGLGSGFLGSITGTYTNRDGQVIDKRELAQQMIFRHYRITGPWVVPLLAGTPLEPTKRSDFQFFDALVDEARAVAGVDEAEELRSLLAEITASWFRMNRQAPTNLGFNQEAKKYPDGFSFDTERGIVSFGEPVAIYNNGQARAGIVKITCAFYAGKDGLFHRASKEVATGSGFNTPTRVISRPEIARRVRYSIPGGGTTEDDASQIDTQLSYWLNAALAEYEPEQGGTINYKQLMRVSPDGLVQQVTWSGGGGREPTTVVSSAQRHNRYVPEPKTKRDRLLARAANDALLVSVAQNSLRLVTGGLGGVGI